MLNLPWKIYFFGKDGKYDKRDVIEIKEKDHLYAHSSNILYHVQNKLEVRVCDSLDYCIMHFKDGKRVFPK